jgi:Icc-related predicted phosphoesterase
MPLIAYVGDIHGSISSMYIYLKAMEDKYEIKLDAVVQVGDWGAYIKEGYQFKRYWDVEEIAPILTYVCPGNHEDWAVLEEWMEKPDQMKNIHLMSDGEITDIAGIKHGAIWGNFSYKSYKNPERVLMARRQHKDSPKANHIMAASVKNLINAGEFDVFISHDAAAGYQPTFNQPHDDIKTELGIEGEKASGCHDFLKIYDQCKPKFHFHGHFHRFTIMRLSEPRITCLHAFGYDPQTAVEIRTF